MRPALAGRDLRDADPAGAFFVVLALAIPKELDADAAVLVDVDFVSRLSDNFRRLQPFDEGLGSFAFGTVLDVRREWQ